MSTSTITEIVGILAEIQVDLNAINLTSEKDLKKIEKMATKPITQINRTVVREDFGQAELDTTVEMFKAASDKVEEYNKKEDIAEAKKFKKDVVKVKEISDRMQARQKVKDAIKGKYDELSRKQAVIAKYTEKYDPNHLIERQNDKLEANNKKIKTNKEKIAKISDFQHSVSEELSAINKNLTLIKELEKIEQLNKEIKDSETTLNDYKSKGYDPDFIKSLEEDLKNSQTELANKVGELNKKYEGISLDTKNLDTSIKDAKDIANNNIVAARDKIIAEASMSKDEYIKNDLCDKLIFVPGDKHEEFIKVISREKAELRSENLNLGIANGKITENVAMMQRGAEVISMGPEATTVYEPTEEEIKERMETDSEISMSMPALTNEEKKQKIYEELTNGAKNKSKWLHPIAAFKAYCSKKTMKDWENKAMYEKAREALIAERNEIAEQNAADKEGYESYENAFKKSLFSRVMKADQDQVKKMDEDAEKAPGAVLTDIYDQLESDEEYR